ncbi:MAG TPA: hypothetical protein VEU96_32835 [Bryobacteraceae bacterium]|nr:hypothetical protein [Bryobacteraceae bacterium]
MNILGKRNAGSARYYGAALALLVVLSAPLRAADDKDKKKDNPPPAPRAAPQLPPRTAPQAQPAPAPAYHPPAPRPAPPPNNPNVGHPPNDNPNMRRDRNPGNQPSNQPNNQPNNARPPGYQPNTAPNPGYQPGRQPNTTTPGGGSQPNTAPNPGYQPGRQPNTTPGGGNQPNTAPNPGYQPGRQPNSTTPGGGSQPAFNPGGGRQPNNNPGGGNQPGFTPGTGRQPNTTPGGGNQPRFNPGSGRQPNNNPGGGNQPGFNPGTGRQPNTTPTSGQPGAGNPGGRYTGGANPRGATPANNPRMPPGEFTRHPNGTSTFRGANNTEAHYRRDGSVREVRSRDVVITHGPGGSRRVFADRGDHRVVLVGRSNGYVERSFRVSNREYVHRTYYVSGVSYTRVYRSYSYGGVYYQAYVPGFYYAPAFYSWAYSPWRAPVYYRWGWAGSPWYGYYGGYFTPYPSYPSASLWLTDYILAANLEEAYREREEAAQANAYQQGYDAGGGGQVALTPDVKQAIAEEVQRQLAQERAEGQAVSRNPNDDAGYGGVPPLFSDYNSHVFVVSSSLEVATSDGQECAVTHGDVLGMNGAPAPNSTATSVRVMASKGGDCPAGSFVSVSLVDLQEMQNAMRASIDQGLQDLQAHKGGLPAPPGDALKGQVRSPVAAAAPPPDANTSVELSQQDQQASQAEQEVVGLSPPDSSNTGAAPDTITLDQTIDQVVGALGLPNTIVDLGSKKIYVYKNMKITFLNGRVSDVQ